MKNVAGNTFDASEADKARTFANRHLKKKRQIFDVGVGSDSWSLIVISAPKKVTKAQFVKFAREENIFSGADTLELNEVEAVTNLEDFEEDW